MHRQVASSQVYLWKPECENTSLSRPAFDFQPATVNLNQALDNSQAKADPLLLTLLTGDRLKWSKDDLYVLLGQTYTGVHDLTPYTSVYLEDRDLDHTRFCKLDCVSEKMADGLFNLQAECTDSGQIARNTNQEFQPFPFQKSLMFWQDMIDSPLPLPKFFSVCGDRKSTRR